MTTSNRFGSACTFVFFISAFSVNAATITYDLTGTVTDAGIIDGVSASLGDPIIGSFSYDTSTLDSNPETTIGEYDATQAPPLKITLPSGSITSDSQAVHVTAATGINIAGGLPDSTTPGNNIDIDIIFSALKSSSTALATDELPTDIDLNDFNSANGAFSSFSVANGPAGDPIFFSIDTLEVHTVPIPPAIWFFGSGLFGLLIYRKKAA